MQKKEQAAKALESELKEKVTVVQSQISVLKGQIAEVQNSIGLEGTGDRRQGAADHRKRSGDRRPVGDFKQHMAAMQELRDGGSVAMLSAVNDLYELLTFNEVMRDISIKDTEILDNMKNAKEALESDKLTLESQRSELQKQKADLDAQNSQMRAKQNGAQLQRGRRPDERCRGAAGPEGAQAAIESDEMNYEAVKKQIQKMIAAAAASKPTLSFTGFICPLKSYSRISSEYGWRKNPVTGSTSSTPVPTLPPRAARPSMQPPAAMCRWRAGPAAATATMSSSTTAKCPMATSTAPCTATCGRSLPRRASMSSRVRSSVMWAAPATLPATTSIWRSGRAAPRPMPSTPVVISP